MAPLFSDPPAERAPWNDARKSWLGDQLIEPTQLVFAVVIASSLDVYRDVIVQPVGSDNHIASLALLCVYLTTVWSWIGWHNALATYPYDIRKADRTLWRTEVWRFYTDLTIVIVYAYMLFRVQPLVGKPGADILPLLVGFPIVFACYTLETTLRALHYGSTAKRFIPLGSSLIAFIVLAALYAYVRRHIPAAGSDRAWLNGITLVVAVALMKLYRWGNGVYARRLEPGAAA